MAADWHELVLQRIMQLLWLGSSQLLDKVECHDVLVLGTRVAISDTARDLGVVIDRELSRQPTSRPSVAPGTISYASSDQ